jgi:subtilisin family serine protease
VADEVNAVSSLRSIRAATTALALTLIAAAPAHASMINGPAMSAAQIRTMQAQGIREIIVERRAGASLAQRAALRAQAGVTYVGPGPLPNTEIDQAPSGGLAAAVAALGRDPEVQFAEPNAVLHAAGVPNDPYFGEQWALSNTGQSVDGTASTAGDDIGATYAWPHSTGSGVTVAVVDTGADATAPDLQGQLVAGASFLNGVQGTTTQDQNGHGTHVSGIIAAAQNNGIGVSGVAPGAKVMPLQALDSSGSGTLDDVASAFAYAGQHNIPIVNASLGGPSSSQTLEQAVADYPNTLYVVAAGNSGANNDDPSTPFYPCDLPEANLICVGASDQNDQPAYFSDYGANSVDLFAPGVNILSTWLAPDYAYDSGTSMATPMVAGTLALMLARNPTLSAAQLKSDLLASVDPAPQMAGLSVSGGQLDAAAAVAMAGGDAPYAAPGNRERPQVSGSAAVGDTLSASAGSWSRQPTGYSYQWERCLLGACLPIPGATTASYTVASTDLGASFEVAVSAANASGSTQALSTVTATVGQTGPSGPAGSNPQGAGTPGTTSASAAKPGALVHTTLLTLRRVALVGRRGRGRGQALVFTLSARSRVQLTLARSSRRRAVSAAVLRLVLGASRGANHYWLTSLLRGHRLPHGSYVLTVRAGGHAVTLRLTL